MRKTITLLLAVVMVLAMAVPMFAVDSPESNIITKAVDKDGADLLPYLKVVDNQVAKAELDTARLTSLLGEKYDSKLVTTAVYDIIYTGTTYPITITFDVPKAKAGKAAYVLHKAASGWEVITPDQVADGSITATFTSLSPVAFVVEETKGPEAPITGNNVALLSLIMLVSLAGTVVAVKRVRA